jgi:hypothetical protein
MMNINIKFQEKIGNIDKIERYFMGIRIWDIKVERYRYIGIRNKNKKEKRKGKEEIKRKEKDWKK